MALKVRLLWYPPAILIALAVIGVAVLSGLCATEPGSRWLLRQFQQQLPGRLEIARIEGTLLGGLSISGVDYTQGADRLQIAHLDIRWQPAALFTGSLQVGPLSIQDAAYRMPAGEAAPISELPGRIALPLAITLKSARISGLQITVGEQQLRLDTIELDARAGPLTGLTLERLRVGAGEHAIDASGEAALQQPYPFHADLAWRSLLPDNSLIRGHGRLQGDVRTITLDHRLEAPAQVVTQGTLSLDGATPVLALAGSWQALQWPLTGMAEYSSRQGGYELQGTLDTYHFSLNGDLSGHDLPALMFQAQGRGNRQQLELEPLTILALDGRLAATGKVAWAPQPVLELRLQSSDLNPAVHWSEWSGRLGGSARLVARISTETPGLALNDIDLHGQLRGYPLQVSGGMALDGGHFSATDLRIRSGPTRVRLAGALASRSGLEVHIAAPELAALWPGLSGRLEAEGRVQGTLEQPAGSLRLNAGELAYRDYAAASLTARGRLDTQQPMNSTAELNATGVRLGGIQLAGLSVHAHGWLERHRLELEATTDPGDARLTLAGAYRDARWKGELTRATFDMRTLGEWRLHRPLAVQATATRLEPLSACWSAGAAGACAQGEWDADHGWRAAARLTDFQLQPLAALWDMPVAIQGDMDAELDASASTRGLEARLQARSAAGEITIQMPEEPPVYQGRYHDANLEARYAGASLHLDAGIRFDEGAVQGRLALTGLDDAAPAIEGVAEADIPDIRFINGLFQDIEITGGGARLQGRVEGRIDAPRLSGHADLEEGSARLPGLGLTLESIRLRAEGQGRRVAISGALRSGAGELALSGDLALDPGAAWPFELALQGADLDVVKLPDIEASASPELVLRGSLSQIGISGRMRIPRARIRVRELPTDVVKVSPDQVIVGAPPPVQDDGLHRIPVRVDVLATLGEDVSFEGLGLTTGLSGAVRIRTLQSGALAGNGVLSFREGRYEGYGQQLDIEQGRLLFAGPLDNPDLDIRATRRVGQVTAGIALEGALEAPETRLFSDPAMPDADILSYIVTGKPLDSASSGSDSQALAAAAASFGANSPVGKEISRTLGVDIGTRSGETDEETAVTVGKQVTPRLYVDYLYGLFTESATLQFIYSLTDHFSLRGESGAEQAIDLHFSVDRD